MKEEGRGGGSELGYDLDLDPDPCPWKILWIRIRQNAEDALDLDPQHWVEHQVKGDRYYKQQVKGDLGSADCWVV